MKKILSYFKEASGFILLSGILSFWSVLPSGQAQNIEEGQKYSKILVLAKVREPEIEKDFEKPMVAASKDKGYNAIPSYSSFTSAELENTDRLIAKADNLKIDSLLAFTLANVETSVINTPQVNASIGVPVRIGFFSVYLGTSIPLGGGPVEEKTVNVKAELYIERNSTEPSWKMALTGNLSDGNDALIYSLYGKPSRRFVSKKYSDRVTC